MYNPLVSIILPVYNGSNYLKQSIDSALAQTYENLEVIVINDGSNDGGATEEIALSYGEKIRYFNKENGGVASALNLGIEKMSGEWFSWLSHDDLYMPNKIESQIQKIIDKNLDTESTVIASQIELIDKNGKKINRIKRHRYGLFSGDEMFKSLFSGGSLYGCALLIPSKILKKVGGFDLTYRYIQDWVCWVTLALEKCNFYIDEEELVKARVHVNQQTKKISHLLPIEIDDFLNKLLLMISNNQYQKKDKIKTVMFYTTKISNREIRLKYKQKLKLISSFNVNDRIEYYFYFAKGRSTGIMKKVYRKFISFKYRR